MYESLKNQVKMKDFTRPVKWKIAIINPVCITGKYPGNNDYLVKK
jgi:hypothetical protein